MANSAVASNDSCIDYMHQIKEMGISEMKYVDNREKKTVFVFLTLTDPLRIQPWSQDRRSQIKSKREYVRRKAGKPNRRERTRKQPAKDFVKSTQQYLDTRP